MSLLSSHDHSLHKVAEITIRLLVVFLPIVVAAAAYQQMKNAKETTVFEIQEITIIEDLPEPEPEPEPEPIVEEQIEEIEIEQVEIEEQVADDMPQSDSLGLDSDGVAGSDAFGLAANKGGRGLLLGGEGGSGSAIMAQYAGKLEKSITRLLQQHDEVRNRDYIIQIALWIDTDGNIQRLELKGTTGDGDVDQALRQILSNATMQIEPPPPGMNLPVNLRIRSSEIS